MSKEEQLLRDIEDYSKNPRNNYVVDRAKRELEELRKSQIIEVVVEDKKSKKKK